MGAMKAIYTDIQELQEEAARDEESFIEFVETQGWVSPTENEIRASKARELLESLPADEKSLATRVLESVGVRITAIDFPFRGESAPAGDQRVFA